MAARIVGLKLMRVAYLDENHTQRMESKEVQVNLVKVFRALDINTHTAAASLHIVGVTIVRRCGGVMVFGIVDRKQSGTFYAFEEPEYWDS